MVDGRLLMAAAVAAAIYFGAMGIWHGVQKIGHGLKHAGQKIVHVIHPD